MNKKILLAEVILAFLVVCAFRFGTAGKKEITPINFSHLKQLKAGLISCSPDWNIINTDSLGQAMKPLPGWGHHAWKIITTQDSAQFYFNQGVSMYYAFHIIESMASFKKGLTFEENNPMLLWGVALAYGPNINNVEYQASPEALEAANEAAKFSAVLGEKEKGLIATMQKRYSADSTVSRTDLNQAYATSMKRLYNRYSGDEEIATLFADALMIQHPWEYWKHNGDPEKWTPEIISVLEKNLVLHPQHPGSNHYYIHMEEASSHPERAMANADRLASMMPLVSHMVHMPSHIYIRTGNYDKGILVNDMSIKGYETYEKLFPGVKENTFLYLVHNLHLKAACTLLKPSFKDAFTAATACKESFDSAYMSMPAPYGSFMQYIYVTPVIAEARYGKWENILAQPVVAPAYPFAHFISLWAKGMAEINTGKNASAKTTMAEMDVTMQHPDLAIVMAPYNAPLSICKVMYAVLKGTVMIKDKNPSGAIQQFRLAVKLEDDLIYNEPRDWLIPSRHYLADALVKNKQNEKAYPVLLEDIAQNPNNFFALSKLRLFEKNPTRKKAWEKDFNAAWKTADLSQPALVY
ncbi:MAG: hypothetical protein ABIT96_01310 [Ferruginibacter sp.]